MFFSPPSSSSRFSLLLALAVGASACFDRDIAAPPGANANGSAPVSFPEPIQLDANYISGYDYVVISWTFSSGEEDVEFTVERADVASGPWSSIVSTRDKSFGVVGSELPSCFRVSARDMALAPEVMAAQSAPLCLSRKKLPY